MIAFVLTVGIAYLAVAILRHGDWKWPLALVSRHTTQSGADGEKQSGGE